MSKTLERVKQLVAAGKAEITRHCFRRLAERDISIADIVNGVFNAKKVEDYPDYFAGPCVLVLQFAANGKPIHVLWGVPRGHSEPAKLVTAYWPDEDKWSDSFMRRRRR